jgi:hypothetical protein
MRLVEDPLPAFVEALEKRHLASLSFAEVRKGLQALSSLYVERRHRLAEGKALDGAGKRAAFALFYGPLHLSTVREIVRRLEAAELRSPSLVDLGCGTLGSGAGWALAAQEVGRPIELVGVERNGWAADEARFALRALGLRGRVVREDLGRFRLPRGAGGVLAAFTANELSDAVRVRLLGELLQAASGGARVLVVEPIARRGVTWWPDWRNAFHAAGGREDEWRFRAELPERLRLLDKAAGLDHSELLARSLYLGSLRPRDRPTE